MKEYGLSAEPTHSVWDRELAPRLVIAPGDVVRAECLDASGGQVRRESTVADFLAIDRTRIHALTGPIAIEGAEPGDVLQVDVLEVAHKGWAWTSVIEGMGFLDARFREPYLFQWELEGDVSRSLAPAVVPLRPFCGVMGVAPAVDGKIRTRPPGDFGGNMDVREVSAGATLYLPVMNEGALFSCGDAHAAQGDGEVCINGMECPADVTLRFWLHKAQSLSGPMVESAARVGEDGPEWIVVESGTDAFSTAQTATSRMVDLLVATWGFSDVHAYLLCSVAMKLRMSQVVNQPMVTCERGDCEEHPAREEAVRVTINDPEVHRELSELYPRYEKALVENDVPTLTEMFWASPLAMRFGVGENLYGVEEIEAFRKARPAVGLARKVVRLDIVTFGRDYGSVTLEFERDTPGKTVRGRQSQVWVRLPEGWRIVAAHVSLLG